MQYYQMWFNLIDSRRDMEFAAALSAYMGYLKEQGRIEGWTLARRKFGFGPDALGEFQCTVSTSDLTQLDRAFEIVATRTGEVERLHMPVYSMVKDFKSGLYRDFPDPQRVATRAESGG